jgi:hypothetical protein
MLIDPKQIDTVETIGELDGNPVEMARLLGGLFLVTGKPKGKKGMEILAAASHPAIAKYQIEKNYRDFRPALQKSEKFEPEVIGLTELLPQSFKNTGHDLYLVKNEINMDFVLTKHGSEVNKVSGTFSDDSLVLSKPTKTLEVGVAHSIGKASAREALSNNRDFVVLNKTKFDAKKMA